MDIDWSLFTPRSALAGGLLTGMASALHILGNGRIPGIIGSPLQALLTGEPGGGPTCGPTARACCSSLVC